MRSEEPRHEISMKFVKTERDQSSSLRGKNINLRKRIWAREHRSCDLGQSLHAPCCTRTQQGAAAISFEQRHTRVRVHEKSHEQGASSTTRNF